MNNNNIIDPIYPTFSVAMSVYAGDNPEWFKEALDSLLTQTILPSEVVIVIDGPVQEDIHIVIKRYMQIYYEKIYFQIVKLEENLGLGNARRVAVERCTNETIAIMDADDICICNRFEQQLNYMVNHPDIDIIGGDMAEFIDSPDNVVAFRKVMLTDIKIKQDLQGRCPFNHVTVMFKKNAVQKAGGYKDWYYNEDYYLWLRMFLCNCKMANTGTVLVKVRVGSNMYQRRGGVKYFKSEIELQKYMLENHIIKVRIYCFNCLKRFIVQILLPPTLRGWVFRKFARQ